MVRIRSLLRIRGGVPPDKRRRRTALLSSTAALGLCAVAGCALFSPGLVFGAGQPNDTVSTLVGAAVVGADNSSSQAGGIPAAAVGALTASQGTLLVTLPWGSGPGQAGLQAPGEGLARGPEAVAIAPDGRIAILGSVNRRLVALAPAGIFVRSMPITLAEPRFIAVSDDTLYVLDGDSDRQLVSLDWNGAPVGATALPALDDVVTGLFASDAGPCVEIAHDRAFLVAGSASLSATAFGPGGASSKPTPGVLKALAGRPVDRGFGPVAKVSFKPGKGAQVKLFKMERSTLKPSQTADFAAKLYDGRTLEHLVSVDGDGRGGLVIGARMLSNGFTTADQPSLVLTRVSPTATLTAAASGVVAGPAATDTLLLGDCPFAYVGLPYTVAPDGRVIQPVADETGYNPMVYTFGRTAEVNP